MSDDLIRRDDMLKWVCDSDLDLSARKQISNAVRALPAVTPKIKPFDWTGGYADCYHTHVNELANGLQSCTSCGAVRSVDLEPIPSPASDQTCIQAPAVDPLSDPRVKALVEALQAFRDFDDLPTSHKRPDVFEIRVRRKLLAALRQFGGEA